MPPYEVVAVPITSPSTTCLVVKEKLLDALKDTGADKSCVELGTALELGLDLSFDRDAQALFSLPTGKVISSVATVRAKCSSGGINSQLHFTGRFFVFESLHVPMLLGNDILDDDGEIRWDSLEIPSGSYIAVTLEIYSPRGDTKTLTATMDTGADCILISMAELMKLGHQPDRNKAATFLLASGEPVESVGQIALDFRLPCWKAPRSANFEVFEKLAVPILLGVELSVEMLGMACLGPVQCPNCEDSAPLVTHLSRKSHRPTRHFRCFVNNKMVRASADTGSDLNLISPSAASRLSSASSIRTEDLSIRLADGSKARVNASFQAFFSPYSAPKESLTESSFLFPVPREIHVLQPKCGHTTIQAIRQLLSIFRTGRRSRSKTDVSSAKPTLRALPPSSTADGDFYAALKVVAAYETHLREKAGTEIAGLRGVQKTIAQDAEKRRIERYEADLKMRLDERKQASIGGS